MGREARCLVRFGGQRSEGKALLETDQVAFRREFRLRIPFRDMTRVEAVGGRPEIDWPEGAVILPKARRGG